MMSTMICIFRPNVILIGFMQATERFEAIYSTLKEVALAGSHGSKAMKQAAQQIFDFALRAAGESMYN